MVNEDDPFGTSPSVRPSCNVPSPNADHGLQQHNEEENANTVAVNASNPQPVAALVPCLRGTMTYVGGIVYCKGKWAMSAAAHDIPGQTSEFEFKLIKADENGAYFPVSGMYQGWFNVKQPPPAKGAVKVEDKEMKISYILTESGHRINGEGYNKYGRFKLNGTLSAEGAVEMYREYYQVNPLPIAEPTPKRGKPAVKVPKMEPTSSPREGGRIRKMSSLLKEFTDPLARSRSSESLDRVTPAPTPRGIPVPAAPMRSSSERAPRLGGPLKRALELLKDICRHPQAVWFLEPVDPIALNIPDYVKIVKNPMDFGTIRANLEGLRYEDMAAFAEHMRLVFRNAMLFNQLPENPVHVAARDLSARFEDKYRSLQRSDGDESIPEPRPLQRSASLSSKKGGRIGTGMGGYNKFRPTYLPPAAMDGSTQTIMEMQRMMASMQDEIRSLRATVKEKEVMARIHETKEAAQNPLTFEEKKILINAIHRLPPARMEQVLDIIQRALPPGKEEDGGEIEVPLDALDTLTLRRLQAFIEDHGVGEKKKRPFATMSPQQQAAPRRVQQKAKKSRPSPSPQHPLGGEDDLPFFEDEDDLLFAADTFEEQSAGNKEEEQGYMLEGFDSNPLDAQVSNLDAWGVSATSTQPSTASAQGQSQGQNGQHEEEEEENLWSVAAAELRSKRPGDAVDSFG